MRGSDGGGSRVVRREKGGGRHTKKGRQKRGNGRRHGQTDIAGWWWRCGKRRENGRGERLGEEGRDRKVQLQESEIMWVERS